MLANLEVGPPALAEVSDDGIPDQYLDCNLKTLTQKVQEKIVSLLPKKLGVVNAYHFKSLSFGVTSDTAIHYYYR